MREEINFAKNVIENKDIEKYLLLIEREVSFQNLSSKTTKAYSHTIKNMLLKLKQDGQKLTRESIGEYVRIYLGGDTQIKRNTRAQYLYAIRFFYSNILQFDNVNAIIPRIKGEVVLHDIYTQEEVAKIINSSNSLDDYTILSLLYSTGMRVNELINLKISDIRTKNGKQEILIRQGKGKKDRIIPLADKMLELLREWWRIGVSNNAKKFDDNYLFPSKDNNPINVGKVQRAWMEAKNRAGLNKPSTGVHTLRRCFATHSLEKNISLYSIMNIMGHSTIISTTRYLRHTPQLMQLERELLGGLMTFHKKKQFTKTGVQRKN